MKIGVDFLADRLGRSGCIGFHRNFIRWLSRLAEDEEYYIFVYSSEYDDYKKYIAEGGEKSVRLVSFGSGDIPRWRRILDQHFRVPRHFRRLGIDRGFSDNVIPVGASRGVTWIYRVLIVAHFHKGLDIGRLRRRYRMFTTRQAVEKSDKILPNSLYTLGELKRTCRVRDDRAVVIGEAYDSDVFYPVDKAGLRERLRLSFGLERPYLLQVSTYVDHKNPLASMRVLAELRSRGIEIDLVLAGGDPEGNRDGYLVSARELGIAENFHALPFQLPDALRLLYNGAECFLYPCEWETFGIPPLEAMACGLPVVASDKSAVPEVVGSAGITVDPGDIEAYACAVGSVLKDEDLKRNMVERGLQHVRNFRWETVVGRIREEIVGARQAGS